MSAPPEPPDRRIPGFLVVVLLAVMLATVAFVLSSLGES